MKKILGISLCALFAVSAANANIASQEYVDEVVGAIDISGIETNAGNITALDGRVTTSEGKISTLEGKVSTNETNIATNAGNISTNTTNIGANTTAISGINATIAGMTANVTGSHFIQGVSQANGIVTPTGKNFETTLSASTNDNAPTSAAVATYVDNKVSGLEVGALKDRVEANESAIGTNTTDIATNASDITALTGRVDTNEQAINGHTTAIAENVTKIGENATKIGANTTAITNLTSDIQGMDLTATTGDYVQVVSQANGTVQATGASFATNVATGGDIAPTSTAVVTYVRDNAVQSVTSGTNDGTIKVDGQEVSVAGLGSAAYEDASTFANATSLKALAYKDTVGTDDIDANAVTSAKIADGTIGNADVATDAAIATSKIAFSTQQTAALGSGITSNLVADINSNRTSINAMLTEANGYDTCKASTYGCTLVVKNRQFYWEAIKRAEGEGAE